MISSLAKNHTTPKERHSWIDIARGIGIILVIYAHVLGNDSSRYLMYAFHMPLFFFLSGIVFKPAHNFMAFVKKSFTALMIPYMYLFMATFIFWYLFLRPSWFTTVHFQKQMIGFFFGNGNNGYLGFNTVLWFLPCLFITRILFAAVLLFTRDKKTVAIILFIVSIIGWLISHYFNFLKLPFGIETALNAVVFLGFGYLFMQSVSIEKISKKINVLLTAVGFILLYVFSTLQFAITRHQIDMRTNRLDNYFLFYLAAFSGIIATIFLSKIIFKHYLLEYIGKYSLILFAWHLLLIYLFSKYVKLFFSQQTIRALSPFFPVVYTVLAIAIILGVNYGYKRIRISLQISRKQ